jgi:prepilin-type N-terminal cleavage/methylation domain-containing protein
MQMYLPNTCQQSSKQKGFTLLELMVVVGIIAVLSGFAIPNFNSYINNQNLRQSQDQVKNDIRSVQNQALTGSMMSSATGLKYWGIKFVTNSSNYSVFLPGSGQTLPQACLNPPSTYNVSSSLFAGSVVRSLGHASGTATPMCLFISFDNGNVSLTTTSANVNAPATIRLGYPGTTGNKCVTLIVNRAGTIELQNNTICT